LIFKKNRTKLNKLDKIEFKLIFKQKIIIVYSLRQVLSCLSTIKDTDKSNTIGENS